MRKNQEKKIYAFIDSQNLNLSIKDCGWMLDFSRFSIYLKAKYKVCKSYLFIGHVKENEDLYASLEKAGFILVFKPTLEYKKGERVHTKGNVDAELVLHTMIEYNNYDQAIIVSGDGDFYCLVEHLLNQKKLLRLLVPNSRKYSALLRGFVGHIHYLDGLKKKLSER